MYKCNQCIATFDSLKKLSGHLGIMIRRGLHLKLDKQKSDINLDELQINDGNYICPYCKKEFCPKGISTHIWRIHGKGINHKPTRDNFVPYNKGLTKEQHPSIQKAANTYKKRIKDGEIIPSFLGKTHTEESKNKIAKFGGYRKGSGRGKSGWYKSYWCDSTWELAWIIYHLDHDIKFERNKIGFEYFYNNRKCKFYPDFLIKGIYIEIKGYMDDKNLEKIKQFQYPLELIVGKIGIKKYLDYAKNKYGSDLTKLYD